MIVGLALQDDVFLFGPLSGDHANLTSIHVFYITADLLTLLASIISSKKHVYIFLISSLQRSKFPKMKNLLFWKRENTCFIYPDGNP